MLKADLLTAIGRIDESLNKLLEEDKPESGQKCGCSDSGCSAHKDKPNCTEDAKRILYRIDQDDETGTAFCDKCAEDALETGMYTNEKVDEEKSSGSLFSEGKDGRGQPKLQEDIDEDEEDEKRPADDFGSPYDDEEEKSEIVKYLDALDVKAMNSNNTEALDIAEEALFDAGVDNWTDFVKAVGVDVANALYTDLNSILKVFNESSFPYDAAYHAIDKHINSGDSPEVATRRARRSYKVTKGSKEEQKLLSHAKKAFDAYLGEYMRSRYSYI